MRTTEDATTAGRTTTGGTGTRPGRRWVLVLGALSAFGPLTTDVYLPGLPGVRDDLDVGASGAQLTLTACLVGLALGQLVVGPLSDAVGRRRPLLGGLVLFVLASVACALAPSILVLDVARVLQGLAGAAGIVIGRAMVRDACDGVAAARLFSTLGAVNAIAPVLSPLVGSVLLRLGSWRVAFVFLTVVGAVLLLATAGLTGETLPVQRRAPGRPREVLRTYGLLLRQGRFLGHALAGGLAFGALFAYIATASFVYQDDFGFSPQVFAVGFAVNGLGLLLTSALNGRLVARYAPQSLLRLAVTVLLAASGLLLVLALADAGPALLLPVLWVAVASFGIIAPNAVALGMRDAGAVAGSAAALIGIVQFSFAAVASPLTGLFGASVLTMAVGMTVLAAAAWLANRLLVDASG